MRTSCSAAATPRYPNGVPSDITITKNHITKPLSWRIGDPTYAGTPWVVKNLLELKNARRVKISGNVLEYCWGHAQKGFAILFTVSAEAGRAPWAVVEDVMFTNNIVRHAGSGININARDSTNASYGGMTRRITVRNNLFEDIDGHRWGGQGRFVQVLHGVPDVLIGHNTILHTGGPLVLFDGNLGGPAPGFIYRNNISAVGDGMCGGNKACGNSTLAYWAPGGEIIRNVIAGASSTSYPAGNYFPGSLSEVRFVDSFQSNYALATDSPYRGLATDGKDLGVDYAALMAATANVVGN